MIRPRRYGAGGRLRRNSDKYGRGVKDWATLLKLKLPNGRWNVKVLGALAVAALFIVVVVVGAVKGKAETAVVSTRLGGGGSGISGDVGDAATAAAADTFEDDLEEDNESDENPVGVAGEEETEDVEEEDKTAAEEDQNHDDGQEATTTEEEVSSDIEQQPVIYERTAKTLEEYFTNYGKATVNIDPIGHYKYVLVEGKDHTGETAIFVQGCPADKPRSCFHPDAYKKLKSDLDAFGIASRMLGGGRISSKKSVKFLGKGFVKIFGYSKTFRKNNGGEKCTNCHVRACALIEAALPKWQVRWSPAGYKAEDESKIKRWHPCREQQPVD